MATLKLSRQCSGKPEIFYSLQGEGPNIGLPSVFLRLATCNLKCSWCDTKYTWDWTQYDYESEVIILDNSVIEKEITSFNCSRLIVTGGEPLLQQNALIPLLDSLSSKGIVSEIETNGTIVPSEEMVRLVSQWNISPKITNSSNSKKLRESPKALKAFNSLSNSYFKFVIAAPDDIDEVSNLTQMYGIPPGRTILMPEGVTPTDILSKGHWLSEICIRKGFRFSTRLHILIWGDKRGK